MSDYDYDNAVFRIATAQEAEPEDYTGEDGLLYCGKCRQPKEAYFAEGRTLFGRDRHPKECDCQRKRRETLEAADREQKHREEVERLKRKGFTNPAMQEWTFGNDNGKCPQMDKALFYVEHWEDMEAENIGYLLWGKVGTGKSYFAGCIANALMEKEISVCMTNFALILNDLAASYKDREGEALYYGLNALSNNLIMANRKNLKNPNGLFLGTPGSGKSFSAKREIVNVFLLTEDDIIIADPENEYGPLVRQFGNQGQVIDISPNSTNYINPMDINLDYSDDENPVTLKSDFILSLCDLIIGGKEGLSPIEKTIIDRCTRLVYREYLQDPRPENMPILGDLYELLRSQSEPEAQNIATALEIYVNGSLNVFNHRSNIQMDKHRVLCFQLKSLGKALKEIGLLIMQDAVWNRVTANRSKHKTTWFYIDEFHLLLKGQTGSFSVEIWKRFRKWGGIPSGLTQNVKDLLASREIENIFENSDFIYMLNQAQGDRQILAKQLGISPHQLSYVTHSGPGEGLLFFGNVIIPFVDHFPKDTLLYSVLTTRPEEVAGTGA